MVVRVGLWVLAGYQVALGVVVLLAPRAFYSIRAVSMYPPYNEHLLRDVGAFNLALGVVVVLAAVRPDRRLAVAALAGCAVFNTIHFVFHVTHLAGFSAGWAVVQTVVTAVLVVLPGVLLWAARGLPAVHGAGGA